MLGARERVKGGWGDVDESGAGECSVDAGEGVLGCTLDGRCCVGVCVRLETKGDVDVVRPVSGE